jgi:hypothetical protein
MGDGMVKGVEQVLAKLSGPAEGLLIDSEAGDGVDGDGG